MLGADVVGPGSPPRKVFVSHCSIDKRAVKVLVDTLLSRGIDAWYDAYEIAPGDDVIAKINEGLDARDVGLVVFSANTGHGRWVSREISTLFHERVEEGKLLIPVILGESAKIPPLLKPLARLKIEDVDRIVDAIHHRRVKPLLGPAAQPAVAGAHVAVVTLARDVTGRILIGVTLDGAPLASCVHPAIPRELTVLHAEFLSGFRHATVRSPLSIERTTKEASVAKLGRALASFCLPGRASTALSTLLDGDGKIPGASIEIAIESDHPDLLSLPYEALRLPDTDRLLVNHPAVAMVRRPARLIWPLSSPLPGPLKILVAVGAPDEGKTASNVLDHERELQNILDAVEPAERTENVEVRILEASDPGTLREALQRDQYHVLYISCHGTSGALELDDEEGNAVKITAGQLLDALRAAGRSAPLMFLNTCHGAVDKDQTASLAEALLRGGVPAVLAMQTSVSDAYGTALARAFFEQMSSSEGVRALASRALAHARREVEVERRKALERGADEALTLPEYATATLFVAGIEAPLVNFGPEKQPLKARTIHHLDGRVPQLRQDDLIGRRRELRRVLWVLRPPLKQQDGTRTIDGLPKGAALAVVGVGGVGKSAVAGRVMRRLAEDGFLIASHVGRWDLGAIAVAVGGALIDGPAADKHDRGERLARRDLDDSERRRLLTKTLSDTSVLLVLDDFEQNLNRDGSAFLDPSLPGYLTEFVTAARRGRLLLTSRYPVPGPAHLIATSAIGPLTDADVRKLLLRLPGLHKVDPAVLGPILGTIGNHPRMLEFLDALVASGVGRLPHVTAKLHALRGKSLPPLQEATRDGITGEVLEALELGARDIFLDELLAITRLHGLADVLLQTAVSNLPVSAAGVAHMLGDAPAAAAAVPPIEQAFHQLEKLSLVFRWPDGTAWVHGWTAECLAASQPANERRARWVRAGRYRRWRANYESRDLSDLIEAVRNFLRAESWDDAVSDANTIIAVFHSQNQTIGVASFVAELLATLPGAHPGVLPLHDAAGKAHRALGRFQYALKSYTAAFDVARSRAEAEPERSDYQRDLGIALKKMADLFSAMGQGEEARKACAASLAIAESLATAKPTCANYQRDLAVAHTQMGDLYRAMGKGEDARDAYSKSLAIRERLAAAEPNSADYQHDLSVSQERMGDVFRALGQGADARKAYDASYAIRNRLAAAAPNRADYQLGLSFSQERIGDVFSTLGQWEEARNAYAASLAIRNRLAAEKPERADYQRYRAVAYNKMGDLFGALGQGQESCEAHAMSLSITKQLADSEPERTDYQRDLAVAYNKAGDAFWILGKADDTHKEYAESMAIFERLVAAEPARADYQIDLVRTLVKTAQRVGSNARELLERSTSILHKLDAELHLAPADRGLLDTVVQMRAALP